MGKKQLAYFCIPLLVLMTGASAADELSDLKEQIRIQQEMLLKLQQKVEALEARQQQQEATVTEIKEVQAAVPAEPASQDKWYDKIKLSGDFRYRHESIDAAGSEGQHRNRIRFRLGFDTPITDELDFSARLATGSQDPVSTNQTLDGGFSSKDIWLDRAFIKYQPKWSAGSTIFAGKMSNPFFTPGKTDLIWDSDLNPEGGAWHYNHQVSENLDLFTNLAAFWVEEQGSDVDEALWGAQGGAKYVFPDESYGILGLGYFDYASLEGEPLIEYDDTRINNGARRSFGNTANGQLYRFDYNLFEIFGEYNMKINNMPVAVFADYVQNLAPGVNEDTAYLFGFRLNKAKDPGSWQFHYDYRYLEADAAVGAFTDSDFIGGGTGGKGHKFGVAWQFTKNIQGGINYFLNERTDSAGNFDNSYRRLQVDFNVKF